MIYRSFPVLQMSPGAPFHRQLSHPGMLPCGAPTAVSVNEGSAASTPTMAGSSYPMVPRSSPSQLTSPQHVPCNSPLQRPTSCDYQQPLTPQSQVTGKPRSNCFIFQVLIRRRSATKCSIYCFRLFFYSHLALSRHDWAHNADIQRSDHAAVSYNESRTTAALVAVCVWPRCQRRRRRWR